MDEKKYVFRLTTHEFAYLKSIPAYRLLLALDSSTAGGGTTLPLVRRDVEALREELTVRSAEEGFDENYSPNDRGELLEKLIDKLYIH